MIVNTPRTVPNGMWTQLIPATTSENVLHFLPESPIAEMLLVDSRPDVIGD